MDGLRVRNWVVPETELSWTFGPSGGPGGQHANRSNTRAELHFDLGATEVFPPEVKERMLLALANRLAGGVLSITADETRSQWRNRAAARRRLTELLEQASVPPRSRKPTRPTRASKERRLESKRRRSEKKRLRGRVSGPE